MNHQRNHRNTVAMVIIGLSLLGRASAGPLQANTGGAAPPATRFKASTDPADAAACRSVLLQIHDAITRFRAEQGRLPNWLSELAPTYLDPKQLVCPYVDRIADLKSWRAGIRDDVFLDPKESTSYAYEFCSRKMRLWTGVEPTWAEFKTRTMKRMGGIGEDAVPIVRCFAHDPILNLAFNGRIYPNAATLNWEDLYPQFKHEDLHPETLFFHEPVRPDLRRFPPRAPRTDAGLLDLTSFYNAYLDEPWLRAPRDRDLKGLPQGLEEFGGVRFDVRGVIQLNGAHLLAPYPILAGPIKIGRTCSRIHFLHGTRRVPVNAPKVCDGLKVAGHIVRYSSGAEVEIPILYGLDVKDWSFDPDDPDHEPAQVAWEGENAAFSMTRRKIRLFRTTWENPWKEQRVESLSLVSAMAESAPFVVAITVE